MRKVSQKEKQEYFKHLAKLSAKAKTKRHYEELQAKFKRQEKEEQHQKRKEQIQKLKEGLRKTGTGLVKAGRYFNSITRKVAISQQRLYKKKQEEKNNPLSVEI